MRRLRSINAAADDFFEQVLPYSFMAMLLTTGFLFWMAVLKLIGSAIR